MSEPKKEPQPWRLAHEREGVFVGLVCDLASPSVSDSWPALRVKYDREDLERLCCLLNEREALLKEARSEIERIRTRIREDAL